MTPVIGRSGARNRRPRIAGRLRHRAYYAPAGRTVQRGFGGGHVRRLALDLEETLYRGTQRVVFEPKDESLWSQIPLKVGPFPQNLCRQGGFQRASAREACFVRCDHST